MPWACLISPWRNCSNSCTRENVLYSNRHQSLRATLSRSTKENKNRIHVLLLSKFIKLSIHNHEKQLHLKLATGCSFTCSYARNLFSYWKTFFGSLLRTAVEGYASMQTIPSGDTMDIPVFETEARSSCLNNWRGASLRLVQGLPRAQKHCPLLKNLKAHLATVGFDVL
ncbi:hypothetical protein HPG69_011472 [Diceros bicornis minor]|uniref:Uncharacterized protein n=1 Tax=Diceros bicornis minor TaxID=77932 RepID=A0A7J7FEG6_DICBM|nr:hypothetical protein HPG69_011472 [Diceros bicornis minor]